jgi:hypothetical protein
MLPSQYFGTARGGLRQEPEYRLVLAILEDAIHCFMKYRFASDSGGRELYEDARVWIESEDRTWPFSYENVCAIVGIDCDYVRDGLRAWERGQLARREKRAEVAEFLEMDLGEVDEPIAVGV